MSEADIAFESEKQMDEFVGLLIDAHNNTRMKENRGHKPNGLGSSAVRAEKKNGWRAGKKICNFLQSVL